MEFEVVYDLVTVSTPLTYFEKVFLVCAALVTLSVAVRSGWSFLKRMAGVAVGILAFCFVLVLGPNDDQYANDHHGLYTAYETGNYGVVEGVVKNFKPGGLRFGRKYERFRLDDLYFKYPTHRGGYDFMQGDGGRIRDGIQIIIWHVNGTIIHLEIARETQPLH